MNSEEWCISRTNDKDLKFKGELLAEYSEEIGTGRRIVLALYKTVGGRFVCVRKKLTQWQGEKHHHEAMAVNTLEDVKAFFGNDDYAWNIYKQAGIENADYIE